MEQIVLQSLVWPKIQENIGLYFRAKANAIDIWQRRKIDFSNKIKFNTYFNSFSAKKWREYTDVDSIGVNIILDGMAKIKLVSESLYENKIEKKVLEEVVYEGNSKKETVFESVSLFIGDSFYLEIESISEEITLIGYEFFSNYDVKKLNPIQIALVTCTYHREKYIEKNIQQLEKEVIQNFHSILRGHIDLYIVDNGKSLDVKEKSYLKIFPNKNLGGVGGFTRGILEVIHSTMGYSHILLMDDDVVVETTALERTYSFLRFVKPEYQDYTIAGALLRADNPSIQFESGAAWNRGKIQSMGNQFNLLDETALIQNERKKEIEYAGWWFSCIPVKQIKKVGLPLPLFIHRDDIEYGLRMKNKFITLNGIGVWHEAYESKMPGTMEYYDLRNMAIVNCIHYDDYSALELIQFLFKWVSGNIVRYRYQYVNLNLLGIQDFCQGFEWFSNLDAQEYHKQLGTLNYKLKRKEEFYGYKGLKEADFNLSNRLKKEETKKKKLWKIFTGNGMLFLSIKDKPVILKPYSSPYELYRRKEVIYVDNDGMGLHVEKSLKQFLKSYLLLGKVAIIVLLSFKKIKVDYQRNYKKLIKEKYWKEYLGVEKGEDEKS